MKLDPNSLPTKPIAVVSTGSLSLDIALGVGGLPRGRIIEIFGPESSGKTTLALQVIAQAQKLGDNCCFIDAEHALGTVPDQPRSCAIPLTVRSFLLDVGWAKKLGVNTDTLLVNQPDSGEQALEIADTLVSSGSIGVIVIDSVAALVPRQELEGEMGQAQIGLQARLMSQALRKLTPIIAKSNTIVIFINQIRMKIGVMFGNPETTSGGMALKFYSSVRMDIRKVGSVKKGDIIVANQMRVKVSKNKVAPPFRTAEFDIEFGKGLSKSGEIIDLGLREKVIEKAGAWYSVVGSGEQLGQGREKAKQFLEENPAMAEKLEKAIREVAFSAQNDESSIDVDEPSSIESMLDSDGPSETAEKTSQ